MNSNHDMNNIKCLPILVLIWGFVCAGYAQVIDQGEIARAVQRGFSDRVYWDTSLNSWDSESGGYEAASATVRAMRGKEAHVTIWREDTPAAGPNARLYYTIHSTNALTERLLEGAIKITDHRVTYVDTGSRPTNSIMVTSNLLVQIPDDLTALARIPAKPNEIVVVKQGLRAFVPPGIKTPQHFFVAPFNKWASRVIIYWVEKRAFIEASYPSGDSDIPIESQFRMGRTYYIDDDKKGELTAEDLLRVEKSRVFWVNRWIANCVTDGVLVEVRP